VFLIRADQLTPEHRTLILLAARAVLIASLGSLGRQLRRMEKREREVSTHTKVRGGGRATAPTPIGLPQVDFGNATEASAQPGGST